MPALTLLRCAFRVLGNRLLRHALQSRSVCQMHVNHGCLPEQRPAHRQELLHCIGKLIALGISNRQRNGHHAAPGGPDAMRQKIEEEQLLQLCVGLRGIPGERTAPRIVCTASIEPMPVN